jgi:hypothetical protein
MKKLALALILTMAFQPLGFSASEWDKAKPAGTDDRSDIDTIIQVNNEATDRLLSNYRRGASISYSSEAQITVDVGEVVCSNAAGTVRKFRANTTVTTVTWADIDTGSEANSTTYYVYAVADADATTATFKISASSTTPTGATYYKRLGSFYNNSSGNIESITNDGEVAVSTGPTNDFTAPASYNQGPDDTGTFYYLVIGKDASGTIRIISGHAAAGATIPLPSGCAQADCSWIVAPKRWTGGLGQNQYDTRITSGRVVTCRTYGLNWVN